MFIKTEVVQANGTVPVEVNGEEQDKPVVVLRVVIASEDLVALDAIYDPASSTSPPAADQRPIARSILDAWRASNG